MRRRALTAALLFLIVGAAPAGAHTRSTSTSSWEIDGGDDPGARILVRAPWMDLQRVVPGLAGLTPEVARSQREIADRVDEYLVTHLRMESGDRVCPRLSPVVPVPSPDAGQIGRTWRVRCRTGGPLRIRIDPFLEALPTHLHLARFRNEAGGFHERVFVLDSTTHRLGGDSPEAAASGFRDYVSLGIQHIASGADHLIFLLALLLVGVTLFEVATIVTGFTVAHSVTLALGVLGVVEPLPAAIESMIGLSIVVVALENFTLTTGARTRRLVSGILAALVGAATVGSVAGVVAVSAPALVGVGLFALCYLALLDRVPRPGRLRWFVAFVFGLVHGFGFAGLLTEVGLPPDRIAAALLGFNVGVELGQIAIVAAAWPLLRFVLAKSRDRRPFWVQVASTPILAAGLYWFLIRALA